MGSTSPTALFFVAVLSDGSVQLYPGVGFGPDDFLAAGEVMAADYGNGYREGHSSD